MNNCSGGKNFCKVNCGEFFFFPPGPSPPQKITRMWPPPNNGSVGVEVSNIVPRCPADGTDSYTQAGVCIVLGSTFWPYACAWSEADYIAFNIPLWYQALQPPPQGRSPNTPQLVTDSEERFETHDSDAFSREGKSTHGATRQRACRAVQTFKKIITDHSSHISPPPLHSGAKQQ